jgi:uncharacterized protein YeaO (DUF488 family)
VLIIRIIASNDKYYSFYLSYGLMDHVATHLRAGKEPRMSINVKRAYDRPSSDDGVRVLVDRLWPRGLRKEDLAVDFWLKDVAPSNALRRWFGHEPRRWAAFAAKYRAELANRTHVLHLLDELRRRGRITLLYGAHDMSHNHAVVLRDVLEKRPDAADSTLTDKGDSNEIDSIKTF